MNCVRLSLIALVLIFAFPSATAQVEAGLFGHYTSVESTALGGAGLRLAFGGRVTFEAEANYDFSRTVQEPFTNGISVVNRRTIVRAFDGLAGPAYRFGPRAVAFFVTAKGGLNHIAVTPTPADLAAFTAPFDPWRRQSKDAVLYLGGGVEPYAGPWGFRLDVGSETIFNGKGSHLRITFGPHFRF